MPELPIGQIIRERRLELGLTQEELAERVSTPDEWLKQADISRIETGAIKLPRPERLGRIADALGLSLGDLLRYASAIDAEGQVLIGRPEGLTPEATPATVALRSVWNDPHPELRLLERVEQAIVITGSDGTIRFWNAGSERLFGWSASEVIGQNAVALGVIDMENALKQVDAIAGRLAAAQHWYGDVPVRRRDGTPFAAFVTVAPVLDQDGALDAIVATSFAVTPSNAARAN